MLDKTACDEQWELQAKTDAHRVGDPSGREIKESSVKGNLKKEQNQTTILRF